MNEVTRSKDEKGKLPRTTARERARHRLDRSVFSLLLALLFLVAVPYGSVDPWWEGAACGAVFALGALWMIEGALGGSWLVEAHRLLLPLAALVAFAFAQTLPVFGTSNVAGVGLRASLSADSFETWRVALKLAALLLFAALLLRYTSGPRRLRALVYAVVFVGVASALFGLARQALLKESLAFVSPRLAANLDGYAQFINRNHFALFAEMSLGAALGVLMGVRERGARLHGAHLHGARLLVALACTLVVWVALVMSGSRGGIVGMCAGLATVSFLYLARVREARHEGVHESRGRGRRGAVAVAWAARLALVAGVLAVTLVGVLWTGGERLASRLDALPVDVGAGPSPVRWGDRRTEIWGASWKLFAAHPAAGIGFGAYRAGITRFHDASGEMSLEQAHNDYLDLLASGGLIAAALVVWQALLLARRARLTLSSVDRFRRATCAGALAGLAAVAAHSLFDFGLHVTANAFLFVALACVVAVGEGRRQGQEAGAGGRKQKILLLPPAVCLLLSASCCWAAWHSMRVGGARLLAETVPRLAFTEYEGEAAHIASEAARLSPSDPESHLALAVAYARGGDAAAAVAEMERAATLRPGYYLTWLKLGRARESAGDIEGALAAYRESINLAPFYAEPCWQLGNTLLRAGKTDEAFAELRRAAASRPSLLPYTAELAWRTTGGDARAVERAITPATDEARVALARFFVKRGEAAAALEQASAARGALGVENRRALVSEMIVAGMFREAYEVWADGVDDERAPSRDAGELLSNGGFESRASLDEAGFNWRFARDLQAVTLSLDGTSPRGGARSLLFEFRGEADTAARLASELVPVEPGALYRLRFAARTENLTSGGMPVVVVSKASGDETFAQSEPLPRDTVGGWRELEIEFRAPGDAVTIIIRRANCRDAAPCPIFGRAWFDDFTLRKL